MQPLPPLCSVSCFVVEVCLSNYNLNSFLIDYIKRPIQKGISDILYIEKHLKNRQIPYQSVRGPLKFSTHT